MAIVCDSKEHLTDLGAALIPKVPAGTLMMSFKLSIGRTAISAMELRTNEAIAAFTNLDPDKINQRFLGHFLSSQDWNKRLIGDEKMLGATLNKAKLAEIEIPLPPLDEQKRIVAKLDEAILCINELSDLSEAKEQHSATLRRALVRKTLGALPGKVTEGNLGTFCDLYQPKTISTKELVPDGKYVVYGANGPIGRYDDFNHVDSEVTMTCRGATCGTINVTPPNVWITGNAMVVRPKTEAVSKEFLACVLPYIDYSKAITGAAQPQITRQSLSPIPISIPSLDVQKEVILKLSAIDDVHNLFETKVKETRLALSSLHDVILKAAFAGQL